MIRLDATETSSFLSSVRAIRPLVSGDPIKITSLENEVLVRATDPDHTAVKRLRSPAPKGELFLSRRALVSALAGAKPGTQVSITPSGSVARIEITTTVGPKRSIIPTMPADAYADAPAGPDSPIPIRMGALRRLLVVTATTERGSRRPYLCGPIFDSRNGCLMCEGSNAKRVGRITSDVPAPAELKRTIVPAEAAALIVAMDVHDDEVVGLSLTENQWAVTSERNCAFGPVVGGDAIDFDRIAPPDGSLLSRFIVDIKPMRDAMEALTSSLVSTNGGAMLFFGVRGNTLTLGQGDNASVRLDIDVASCGDDGWAWTNAADVAMALKLSAGSSLQFSFNSDSQVMLIEAPEDDPSDLWFVSSIMRVPCWPAWQEPIAQAAE